MSAQSAGPTHTHVPLTASRWAQGSFWALAVFALWTVAFVVASGPLAQVLGSDVQPTGEVAYIEGWAPWIGITVLWVLPLLVGIALGVVARVRGCGTIALVGIGMNVAVLLFVVVPAVVDRILTR